MPTKMPIMIKVVKPYPDIRLGCRLFGESRKESLDMWSDKSHVIRKTTGEKIPKSLFYEEVNRLNLSFNKMVFIGFHIHGSTLFRDFLYTFNNTSQWAVPSRTINSIQEYRRYAHGISEEFWVNNEVPISIRESLKNLDEKCNEVSPSDVSPNEYLSQYINMSHSTEFWWGCNLQSLFKILKFMEEEIPLFYNFYGRKIIEQLDIMMVEQIHSQNQFTRLYESSKDKIFYDDFINQYLNLDSNKYIFSISNVGLGLYSQLIRHSDIVTRGFIDLLRNKSNEELRNMDLTSQFCIPKLTINSHYGNRFERVIKTQMCWYAKNDVNSNDSWMKLIEPYLIDTIDNNLILFAKSLPCKGNCHQCTIEADMKIRVSKSIPETPCAILCESRKLAEMRYNKFNSRLTKSYLQLFDEGIVKDNPDNKYQIAYFGNSGV